MFRQLTLLLDFIYTGEVNVLKDDLNAFLSIAGDLKIEGLTSTSTPKQAKSGLSSTQENFDPQLTSTPSKAPPTSNDLNQMSTPSLSTSDLNNPEAGLGVIKKEPSDPSEQPCATPQSINSVDLKSLVRKAQDSDKRAVICVLCGKKIKGGNAEGVRHVVDVLLKHEGWEANNRGVYYSHKKEKSKEQIYSK